MTMCVCVLYKIQSKDILCMMTQGLALLAYSLIWMSVQRSLTSCVYIHQAHVRAQRGGDDVVYTE